MESSEGLRQEEEKPWRVLEFYSGIGGMVQSSLSQLPAYAFVYICVNVKILPFFIITVEIFAYEGGS